MLLLDIRSLSQVSEEGPFTDSGGARASYYWVGNLESDAEISSSEARSGSQDIRPFSARYLAISGLYVIPPFVTSWPITVTTRETAVV